MKARGLLPLQINAAPIHFSSVETTGLCGFWTRTLNLLISSYTDDLRNSLLKLLTHIDGFLASGLIWASQGQQAAIDRQWERVSQAPSSPVVGLSRGTQAFVRGIGEGLTGIVDRPISVMKKEGIKGLAKGLAQGVAGLVARPVAYFNP
jgi:hypothetical protein